MGGQIYNTNRSNFALCTLNLRTLIVSANIEQVGFSNKLKRINRATLDINFLAILLCL